MIEALFDGSAEVQSRRTSGIETGARRALKRSFRSSTSRRLSSWRRSLERLIELVVQGTLIGSLYALVALGFVLIYKASRVINFAQGELVMMGGYLGVAFTALYGVPWPLAFLLTIAISAAVGVGIERTVLRPLIGRPLVSVVMATIALAVFIRGVLPTIWGPSTMAFPPLLPREP